MSLTLYYHPLSSFCWKALIALYENDTPFTPVSVDLGNPREREALLLMWPVGKFPVLEDETGQVIPESSIIIDYLDQHHPGPTRFIPRDADSAREARLGDRFYDLYVHLPVQAIVGDRLRPAASHDPHGVADAQARLRTSYRMIDRDMATRSWAMGDSFSIVDCAAFPALFYANKLLPLGEYLHAAAYLDRLLARPSVARVVKQAEPYLHMFPQENVA